MFDTLTMSQKLTDAGIEQSQAKAITEAVREAAEHGEHVTPDMLRAELATSRTEIASLQANLTWRMIGIVGVGVVVLRLWS